MKKIIAFLSIAALCLTAISCVRELEESGRLPQQGTKVTLTVSDEAWVSTRSAYTPGEGVKLTQNEQIGLFYDNGTLLVGNNSYAIKAAPQGAGVYGFTAPEGSFDKTWYAIVPYSYNQARARINTSKQFHIVFPCTQFPGQNTFDPSTDFLVGKPFMIDADGARTATIDAFKRLTAPFKLEITGLESGEKIYAVTFAQSTKASGYNASTGVLNVLAGKCLFKTGAEPDDFAFDSVNPPLTRSNDVSAIYDAGLEEEGGVWPVWFNVLPGTIARNTQITVTVYTANACYTRTASIGGEAKTFATDKINKMAFNIKGEGYTSEPAISQGFFNNGMDATTSNKTVKLTATDGVERDWEIRGFNWTAAAQDGGSVLPSVLGFPKGVDAYVKLPAVAGSQIKKVRLYLAPVSHLENYAFPLEVYDGETLLATVTSVSMLDQNPTQGYTPGGIIDIPCPEGVSDMAGLTLKFGACTRNANALVSRIVLYTSEAQKPEGDYYQDFLDGKDIVIGNQTYNINDDDIKYTLIETNVYSDFRHAAMSNDIVFVENALTLTLNDEAGIVLTRPRPLAIVGRYKVGKGQPYINMQGKFWQIHGGGLSLLNVKMASVDNLHGLMLNEGSTVNCSVNIIDCTIEAPQYLCYDKEQVGSSVTSFIIDNSIIAVTHLDHYAATFIQNAGKEPLLCPLYRRQSITNTVFYDRTPAKNSFRLIVFSSCAATDPLTYGNHENLELTFKNNSLYKLVPRYVYSSSNSKSVVIDKNVMFGKYYGSSDNYVCMTRNWSYYGAPSAGYVPQPEYSYPSAETSSISNNTIQFTDDKPWIPYMTGTETTGFDSWYTITGNVVTYNQATSTVFGTCDADKLYFPVNTAVVTNGGGATYDTKLWQTWN